VAWSEDRGLQRLSEITADVLDQWKAQWKPTAKRPDDRMGRNTAGRHLAKVKAFLRYCQRMGWTQMNAAIQIRAIKAEDSETLPLLGGRYEQVLQATYDYDKAMRPDDRYGPDMRALFELMRWSGLRISDALARERASITANRLTLRTVKSQGKRKLTFVLPDHVIAAALVQTAGPASRVGCSGG
jgi:integrase/recombinase XerC